MMSKFERKFKLKRRKHVSGRYEDEVSPTDGVMNIADVMLVFACGLLLAIFMFWNVDAEPQNLINIEQGQDMTQIDEVQEKITESESGGGYEKMGTVYKDPDSGELYMLEDE